jgi:hypothetical protein
MYVKSLISRIKNTPSKAWNDWKIFRNYPGMEYRDLHNIIPKSHMWKFPSQGSIKYENKHGNTDFFKWDYKLAFRSSPYFIRRIYPESPKKYEMRHSFPITPEDMTQLGNSHLNWKDQVEKTKIVSMDNSSLSVQEKYNEYEDLVKNMFETRDLLSECKKEFF